MKKMKKGFTLVEIMIVVAIIAILAAVAIPNFVKYRRNSQAAACVSNLKQLEAASEQWRMAGNGRTSAPTMADICGKTGYIKVEPTCPAGGTYTLGDETTSPTCDIARTLDADDQAAWHDLSKATECEGAGEGS